MLGNGTGATSAVSFTSLYEIHIDMDGNTLGKFSDPGRWHAQGMPQGSSRVPKGERAQGNPMSYGEPLRPIK